MFIPLSAEVKSIKLEPKAHNRESRSLVYTPTITCDSNILRINSTIPLENLQVIITDQSTGDTLYFSNITVSDGQPYMLTLNAESGNYKIELNIGQDTYYGFFDL